MGSPAVSDSRSSPLDHYEPLVSVVVCAYSRERLDQLKETIESLRQQTYANREIILVIDNNPSLQEEMNGLVGDAIRVSSNTGAQGLADARNSGIELAGGEIIAFIDDDAAAEPAWLAGLVECYRDPDVVGCGGRIVPVWDGGPEPAWLPNEFRWVIGCTYRGMPERGAVRNVIGCNMSFRSSVFEAVGRFTSGIGRFRNQPLRGEETEICIRALKHWPDKKIVYTPEAVVHHHVSPARQTVRYFARRCYFEGISKVIVRRLWGAAGTSAEFDYLSRTIPEAILRELRNVVRLRDLPASLSRLAAITLGVGAVGAGFTAGTLLQRVRSD